MTQAKFTEPPCGHPWEQVRLLGLPGSCSLASETRQPSAHSHGYRAGKGWLWWHRHGTGVALSSAGHDASVEQLWASTGQISPLLPSQAAHGLWSQGEGKQSPGQPLERPKSCSASQSMAKALWGVEGCGNESLAHQLAQHRPNAEPWPCPRPTLGCLQPRSFLQPLPQSKWGPSETQPQPTIWALLTS